MIDKQIRWIMKLLSQFPGALTPSIMDNRDIFAVSPFVEKIAKAKLPEKLNLPTLTATYDG